MCVEEKNDIKFIYDHYRGELTFEANMVAQRTGWFITSQAFLFSCLVLGVKLPAKTLGESLYFPLIPILAIIICILTFMSIMAATQHADRVRDELKTLCNDTNSIAHKLLQDLHKAQVRSERTINWGLIPAIWLPIAFLSSWAYIMVCACFSFCFLNP